MSDTLILYGQEWKNIVSEQSLKSNFFQRYPSEKNGVVYYLSTLGYQAQWKNPDTQRN